MRLTNTTSTNIVFGDSNRIIKFVNRIIVPANSSISVDIEFVIPLALFDRGFQNCVARGQIVLNFGSIAAPSRSRKFLCAVLSLLNARTNWSICLLPYQSSSSSSYSFSSSSSSFSSCSSSFSSSSFSSSSSSFSSSSFSSSSSSFSSSSSSFSSSSFSSSSSSFSSSSSSFSSSSSSFSSSSFSSSSYSSSSSSTAPE